MDSVIIKKALKGEFALIAEIGVNYYDIAEKMNITPLEAAELMIGEAKKAGIHAVKFQSYKAETLAAKQSPSYWDTNEERTTSQYELFKKFDSFSGYEYKILSDYAKSIDVEFMSTAFDVEAADYLYELMNVYKISSSDLNNLAFIEYQAKKGKPIILSVGASYENEIVQALKCIRKYNNEPVILMHCILEYPTPYKDANLNRIVTLKEKFNNVIIGYSDHTKPDECADVIKTAYNLGAVVIEKHFTLDKTLKGNDHYHAMDTHDAQKIICGINFINEIRGSYAIKCLENEKTSRQNARRSLVSKVAIKAGETITNDKITFKRPGIGIPASDVNDIVGKVALFNIDEDTILQYSMLDK